MSGRSHVRSYRDSQARAEITMSPFPRAMVMATRTSPTPTMPSPLRQPGLPAYRPSNQPRRNSIRTATVFDRPRASRG